MKVHFVTPNNNIIELNALCDIVAYILSDGYVLAPSTDLYVLSAYLEQAFKAHFDFLEAQNAAQATIDTDKKLIKLAEAWNKL